MQPVFLFDIAARRAEWLSVRQTAIAENVANADTPTYAARDIEPFETTLRKTELAMAATNPGHLSLAEAPAHTASIQEVRSEGAGQGGNNVDLEQELIKAGGVSRDYALNVSIVKSFHRMWMSSVKA